MSDRRGVLLENIKKSIALNMRLCRFEDPVEESNFILAILFHCRDLLAKIAEKQVEGEIHETSD
jgi:hypothetical protein